jgi:hypothetical protein
MELYGCKRVVTAEGNKMNYPMFDHLRMLSDVLTASGFVFGIASVAICLKLLVTPSPVNVALAHA